jgi:hypothetical protein
MKNGFCTFCKCRWACHINVNSYVIEESVVIKDKAYKHIKDFEYI